MRRSNKVLPPLNASTEAVQSSPSNPATTPSLVPPVPQTKRWLWREVYTVPAVCTLLQIMLLILHYARGEGNSGPVVVHAYQGVASAMFVLAAAALLLYVSSTQPAKRNHAFTVCLHASFNLFGLLLCATNATFVPMSSHGLRLPLGLFLLAACQPLATLSAHITSIKSHAPPAVAALFLPELRQAFGFCALRAAAELCTLAMREYRDVPGLWALWVIEVAAIGLYYVYTPKIRSATVKQARTAVERVFALSVTPIVWSASALCILANMSYVYFGLDAETCEALIGVNLLLRVGMAFCSLLIKSSVSDERAIVDRDSALVREKLRLQEERAEERQKQLRFVFHELRVPLNAVCLGLSELLADSERHDPDTVEALTLMSAASTTVTSLISDLLDIAKAESGSFRIALAPLSLPAMARSVAMQLSPVAHADRVRVWVSVHPSVPEWVMGDPLRLTQALCNYANNAIKFVPHNGEGSVDILVELEPRLTLGPNGRLTRGGGGGAGPRAGVDSGSGGKVGAVAGGGARSGEEEEDEDGGDGPVFEGQVALDSPIDSVAHNRSGCGPGPGPGPDAATGPVAAGGVGSALFLRAGTAASASPPASHVDQLQLQQQQQLRRAGDGPSHSVAIDVASPRLQQQDGGGALGPGGALLPSHLPQLRGREHFFGSLSSCSSSSESSFALPIAASSASLSPAPHSSRSDGNREGGGGSAERAGAAGARAAAGSEVTSSSVTAASLGVSIGAGTGSASAVGASGRTIAGHRMLAVGEVVPAPASRGAASPSAGGAASPALAHPSHFVATGTVAVVRLTVRDNGIGISQAQIGALFSAFMQLEAGQSYAGRSSGLGLAIVREIVARHGGRVGVASQPGHGSEFFCTVPLQVLQPAYAEGGGAGAGGGIAVASGAGVATQPLRLPRWHDVEATDGMGTTLSRISTSAMPPGASSPLLPPYALHPSLALLQHGGVPSLSLGPPAPNDLTSAQPLQLTPPIRSPLSSHGASLPPQASSPSITSRSSTGTESLCDAFRGLGRPLRVLVVDDVRSNRYFLVKLLQRTWSGCVVAEADDGAPALEMVKASLVPQPSVASIADGGGGGGGTPASLLPYDVITLDYEMPTPGPVTAQRLRAAGCACAIIGITGNALDEDRDRFLAAGATTVLPKPVPVGQLREAVDEHIQALLRATAQQQAAQ